MRRSSNRLGGWANPNDHIDTLDHGSRRGLRQMLDRHLFIRDVDQATRLNIEEVVVAPRIRVEVRAASLDHDLFEETVVIELVEGVVDGRQGHPKASRLSFAVKLFGRHMAVFRTEQKTAERTVAGSGAIRGLEDV